MPFFDDLMREQYDSAIYRTGVDLICRKFSEHGISVSSHLRKKIESALRSGQIGRIRIGSLQWWKTQHITIQIDEEDLAELDEEVAELFERIPSAIRCLLDDVPPDLMKQIKLRYPKDMKADEKDLKKFRSQLNRRWAPALSSLSLMIELSTRVGTEAWPTAKRDETSSSALSDVLFRLHGQGVKIGKEVLTLLRAGYADAAIARWRTLHETAVVGAFIAEFGEECAIRFLAHQIVGEYRAAVRYQEAAPGLGFTPIPESELEVLGEAHKAALDEYGKEFRGDYGWSSTFMKKRPITFAALERVVEMDHLRPFYGLASERVHTTSQSLLYQLASPPDGVLLIGPSNYGLADPGQLTGFTITLLTALLTGIAASLDVLMGARMLQLLAEETADLFVRIQLDLETEETEFQDREKKKSSI